MDKKGLALFVTAWLLFYMSKYPHFPVIGLGGLNMLRLILAFVANSKLNSRYWSIVATIQLSHANNNKDETPKVSK